MLKSIKISLKDSLIYGLGNIAVKVIGFILIPLYTDPKFFSVDDFGIIGLLDISGLVLTALLASALPQTLTRWFWEKDHARNQKGIFFMTLATQVVVSLVFCILLIPLSGTFSDLLLKKTDWQNVITLVIIASSLQAVNNIVNTLMRLQSRSILYTFTNLLKLIVVLALTLYFIIFRNMGIEGIYLAQVMGNTLFLIILAGYTIKNSSPFFDWNLFKSMNTYGFPLLLANVAAVLLNVIDRYSLNSLALLKYVALYTLAFKITSILKFVIVDSIKLTIAPMMFKRLGSPDNKRFYSKVLLYTSYILMFAIVGISLFSLEIVDVISRSPEFRSAVGIIPVLSLSIFFVNLKEVTVYGLHFAKKTKVIGSIVVLTTLLNLGLNIALIPFWDIMGAAAATLISQIIYWLAIHFYSRKYFFIPYEMRKIGILFIVGTLLSFLSLAFNEMSIIPRLALKTIVFLGFPFILYMLKFYEQVELQAIRGFFAKWSDLNRLGENLRSLKNIKDEF